MSRLGPLLLRLQLPRRAGDRGGAGRRRWRWRWTGCCSAGCGAGNAITLVIASFGAALALRNLLQFLYGPAARILLARDPDRGAAGAAGRARGPAHHAGPDAGDRADAAGESRLHLQLSRTTLAARCGARDEAPRWAARRRAWTWSGCSRASWVHRLRRSAALGAVMAAVGRARCAHPSASTCCCRSSPQAILGRHRQRPGGAVAGGFIVGLAESLSVPLVGANTARRLPSSC
jgi:branched-chain amino acid transport system permease protein